MAEIIIIDDDSDDNGDDEVKTAPHILKMKDLTEKLKQKNIPISSSLENENGGNDNISKWRMKLNPFRSYDFLYKSKYAFEDLNESKTYPMTFDIFSLPNGDASDDVIIDDGGEKKDAVKIYENVISDMEGVQNVDEENTFQVKTIAYEEEKTKNSTTYDELLTNISPQDENKSLTLSSPHKKKFVSSESFGEQHGDESSDMITKKNSESDESMGNNGGICNLPYYLKNFLHILTTVTESDDKRLFDKSEIETIQTFNNIPVDCQELYIRLYQRKRDWFRCDKINYPKIANDLTSSFKGLVDIGLLHDENSLVDFDDICKLLTAPETRSLADDIKLKVNKTENNSKIELIKLLKKHCQKQRTIFMSKSNSMKSILSKNAKKYIGKCVKLKEEERFLFTRIILLFCLTTSHLADTLHNNGQGTAILYQMLLSNLGDVRYPSFKLNKRHEIFSTREQLIEYAHAVELENEFEFAVEKKDIGTALKCYEKVRPQLLIVFENLLTLGEKVPRLLKRPQFLSSFSKEWVTIRLANKCVDILEKERNYSEAVTLIELLLSQKLMRSSSRGFLWERLILDYERHLKDSNKAYLYTLEALRDPYLRTGHRFDILQRSKRLEKSPKVNAGVKDKSAQMLREEISEPKEETIHTKIFLESSAKNRAVFLSPAVGDNYKLSNVEQHVITHYEELGFPSGRHGEGSTVTTLFFLLFWDIIFMDVEDVFQSKFQNSPLDMFSDSFYLNREDELNERLNMVYHASDEYLRMSINNAWKINYGTYAVCVNWTIFEDETEAGDLAICIGRKVLGGICELFCKDLRRRTSGFPDLIVWNTDEKTCKIVEVKGPGDKLSVKQIVWLDVLNYLGADAFACYVTGVGGKRKWASVD